MFGLPYSESARKWSVAWQGNAGGLHGGGGAGAGVVGINLGSPLPQRQYQEGKRQTVLQAPLAFLFRVVPSS